jgi:hypothetical protein
MIKGLAGTVYSEPFGKEAKTLILIKYSSKSSTSNPLLNLDPLWLGATGSPALASIAERYFINYVIWFLQQNLWI